MSFNSLIKSRIVAHLASERRLLNRRDRAERRRQRRNAAHEVDYFHDVADPYAHLTAQVLQRLEARYDIVLRPHLISCPPDGATPARAALQAYSRLDATRLAVHAGLDFPDMPTSPTPERIDKARSLIAAALDQPDFAETAVAVGAALWQGAILPDKPEADPRTAMSQADALLARRGHYLGATFFYAGEWYWGIDRLHYLEDRLRELGAGTDDSCENLLFEPPFPDFQAPNRPDQARSDIDIEMFGSFRSPYSWIAFDRVRALACAWGVGFCFRPVLPMLMRGLAVPRQKSLYILGDVAREARRMGIPFGRACDPLGRAVERGYALIGHAREAGRLNDYVSSYLRGVWADGIDANTDQGLSRIVERAGLDWGQARPWLRDEGWRVEVEQNRQELTDLGLWGVPSFRVGETYFWGQDRLWLLEAAISKSS